jgi:methionyl-tRNA formyltransferase
MKIVFFGTSNVALPVLEALHKHHDVLTVVTQPDAVVGRDKVLAPSPMAVLAASLGLPIFKPEKVKGNIQFAAELKKLGADVFIVVSYGKILPLEVINLPHLKTLNIHFSLLPKYRGASPIQFALLNGEKETGTTIFVLDERMDTGPIIAFEKFPISANDNFITFSKKLADVSAKLLLKILPDYESGKIVPVPQDDTQATYTKIISKDDGRINWTKTATEIHNMFRAYIHWPGIWTTWDGKKIKLTDVSTNADPRIVSGSTDVYGCGTVTDGGIVVCGQKTFLKINKLQLEGKKETDINSFLNGYRNFIGAKLE